MPLNEAPNAAAEPAKGQRRTLAALFDEQVALAPGAMGNDSSVRARVDALVLKLMRNPDAPAARAMRDISLGFAAAAGAFEVRVFWKLCAAYFEALWLGLCPFDQDGKRVISGILLQDRQLGRGELLISQSLLRDLVSRCIDAVPGAADKAPVLQAVHVVYGKRQPQTSADLASAQPAGGEFGLALADSAEQFKVIGNLRIGIPAYNLYLNEVDEWSRRLITELSEWALELHRPVLASTVALARSLSERSASVGFVALSGLASALQRALQQAQGQAHTTPGQVKVFVDVAEEISRLLHQFAAGFLKEPDPALAESLAAATHPASGGIQTTDTAGANIFPILQRAARQLLPQLGGALRQWTARPENVGARNEVLRILHTLQESAQFAGAGPMSAMCQQLASAIEQLSMEQLQPHQLASLLGRFDQIESHFDGLCRSYSSKLGQ